MLHASLSVLATNRSNGVNHQKRITVTRGIIETPSKIGIRSKLLFCEKRTLAVMICPSPGVWWPCSSAVGPRVWFLSAGALSGQCQPSAVCLREVPGSLLCVSVPDTIVLSWTCGSLRVTNCPCLPGTLGEGLGGRGFCRTCSSKIGKVLGKPG